MHHIQKYILRCLTYDKYAKFSAMRPPNVESNAYSYHLRALQKDGYVEKTEKGYRLSPFGLGYVDRVNIEKFETRLQPKIITLLVFRDDKNRVLLWSKRKQPFIHAWSLPNGKLHLTDTSVLAAAEREATEKIGVIPSQMRHVGDCYVRAFIGEELISYVLAHVFVATFPEELVPHENSRWFDKAERAGLKMMPATEEIITKVMSAKKFFFTEYEVHWQRSTFHAQSVTIGTNETL